MKKILSFALVVLMLAGMASSAFAASEFTVSSDPTAKVVLDGTNASAYDNTGGILPQVDKDSSNLPVGTGTSADPYMITYKSAVYKYNSTDEIYKKVYNEFTKLDAASTPVTVYFKENAFNDSNVKPGNKLAIEILSSDNKFDKKEIDKLKAFFDADRGSFAEGPTIQSVKTEDGYKYCVVFKLPDPSTSVDIAGNLAIAKTATAAKNASTSKFKVGISAKYNFVEITGSSNTSLTVSDSDDCAYNFKSDAGEVDVEFGKSADLAMFTVDASGQGKVNMKYSTDYNADFSAMYPNANIDFLSFVKTPSFNRTGTLYIYADKDTFVYEVTKDGAKAVNATYDESYGAWAIKTRTLGAYAISDVELKLGEKAPETSAPAEEKPAEETVKPDAGKTNPPTGR